MSQSKPSDFSASSPASGYSALVSCHLIEESSRRRTSTRNEDATREGKREGGPEDVALSLESLALCVNADTNIKTMLSTASRTEWRNIGVWIH